MKRLGFGELGLVFVGERNVSLFGNENFGSTFRDDASIYLENIDVSENINL